MLLVFTDSGNAVSVSVLAKQYRMSLIGLFFRLVRGPVNTVQEENTKDVHWWVVVDWMV